MTELGVIHNQKEFVALLNEVSLGGSLRAPHGIPKEYPARVLLKKHTFVFEYPYKVKVVGIYSNSPRSGKSVVADAFVKAGATRLKMSGTLKKMAVVFLGDLGLDAEHAKECVEDHKTDILPRLSQEKTVRQLLSTLGHEWGRVAMYPDLWVDIVRRQLEETPGLVVIDDIRYPNEVAKLVYDYDGVMIRVDRPHYNSESPLELPGEGNLADLDPDIRIVNDGTFEDLQEAATNLARSFLWSTINFNTDRA